MSSTMERMKAAVAARRADQPVVLEDNELSLTQGPRDLRRNIFSNPSVKILAVLMALVAFYFLVWAADIFATQVEISIQSSSSAAPAVSATNLLGGLGGGASPDALLVQSYIGSRDLLDILNEELDLKSHYSAWRLDVIARMTSDPSAEDFLDYYQKRVKAVVDVETGNLTFEVQAFSPEFSEALSNAILRRAEDFINVVNQTVARDEVTFIQQEVERARQNLNGLQDQMVQFQRENRILDASASSAALQGVVNQLEGLLVTAQAEEKQLASFLNDGAPELEAARARIVALSDQLAEERGKLQDQDQQAINEVGLAFRALQLEITLATDLYSTALKSLEQARVNSSRKLKHLVTVQSPALPDEAIYPRRIYNTVSAWIALLVSYGIVMLIYATIQEHRDV